MVIPCFCWDRAIRPLRQPQETIVFGRLQPPCIAPLTLSAHAGVLTPSAITVAMLRTVRINGLFPFSLYNRGVALTSG